MTIETNWARNYTYRARSIEYPETIEQVCGLVRESERIRALGSRHCFNSIADSLGTMVSMRRLNGMLPFDPSSSTVTVEGGATYGDIGPTLHAQGAALHNLASLPHISIVGACATATHGSGNTNGNLGTSISAMDIVGADGSIRHMSRRKDPETFGAYVMGLGALGIVASVTLDVIPAFEVSQRVYRDLPLETALGNFDAIEELGYSVSLFTDWSRSNINQLWVKFRSEDSVPDGVGVFGAKAADRKLHPVERVDAEPCTEQLGVPGPWYQRLPHFKHEFTPSVGEELQTEYFIPRQHAIAALKAVDALGSQIVPLLQISEIRTIAADDQWLSPCYQQPCIAIHFTWFKREADVLALLPKIEAALAPFSARPHWGKLFTMSAEAIAPLYSRLPEFLQLARQLDPGGKFWNSYLESVLGGT